MCIYKYIILYQNDVHHMLLNTKINFQLKSWLTINRGCFLLVFVYENGTENTKTELKDLLQKHAKLLKKEKSQGAKILRKHIEME